MDAAEVAKYAALDARMVRAARGLRLLHLVSWPARVQDAFLAQWRAGKPALPQNEYPKHDFAESRRELEAVAAEADPSHPLGQYLQESAQAWSIAAQLLESLGTPRVGALSSAAAAAPIAAIISSPAMAAAPPEALAMVSVSPRDLDRSKTRP